jgi:hypothetical protein
VRNSDHVFVVVDGKLERRAVRLIAWDGEDAIVDGSLENGDTVLVTRLTEATDGVRVREPSMADAPIGTATAFRSRRGRARMSGSDVPGRGLFAGAWSGQHLYSPPQRRQSADGADDPVRRVLDRPHQHPVLPHHRPSDDQHRRGLVGCERRGRRDQCAGADRTGGALHLGRRPDDVHGGGRFGHGPARVLPTAPT